MKFNIQLPYDPEIAFSPGKWNIMRIQMCINVSSIFTHDSKKLKTTQVVFQQGNDMQTVGYIHDSEYYSAIKKVQTVTPWSNLDEHNRTKSQC